MLILVEITLRDADVTLFDTYENEVLALLPQWRAVGIPAEIG